MHFSLLRLQLVELIRASFSSNDSSAVATAIEFAQHNLAPYATLDPQFKTDLERAMALLIVPRESWTQTPSQAQTHQQPSSSHTTAQSISSAGNDFGALAELVDPSLRRKIAQDVNEAILQSQGERREANIRYLVRARAWAEQLAREKKIDLPERLSLGLDGDDADAERSANAQGSTSRSRNGHADTDMVDNGSERTAPRRSARGAGGGNGGEAETARYTNIPS